jgi:small subunit ribosomal protein S16
MPVCIRFARYGKRNVPFYRIMVADNRRAPVAKFIEHIGTYNPIANKAGIKDFRLNVNRAKFWLVQGAQPSPAVQRLFGKFEILPPPPARVSALKYKLDMKYLKFGPPPVVRTEAEEEAEMEAAAAEEAAEHEEEDMEAGEEEMETAAAEGEAKAPAS